MDSLEVESAILKILLVIFLMVSLVLISGIVFMYRRNRTLENKITLNDHLRQAEHEAESSR